MPIPITAFPLVFFFLLVPQQSRNTRGRAAAAAGLPLSGSINCEIGSHSGRRSDACRQLVDLAVRGR
jgi:hypothetical protein